ncbi:hypothetical protein DB346_18745 [Verrucomicrobia bacterium LW23]|nr:hypothetical protein DB346_18745 [Verrucomicrobia bacterium LW23]
MKRGLFSTIVAAMGALLLLQAVGIGWVMLHRAQSIEQELLTGSLRRAVDFVHVKEEEMRVKIRGYAAWTEMQEFLVNYRADFEEEISPSAEKVHLLFVVSDSSGKVFGKLYDSATNTTRPAPESIYLPLIKNPALTRFRSFSESIGGIIVTPEGAMLLMVQQVVQSDGSGPRTGVMYLGRYIDDTLAGEVSAIVRRDVRMWPTTSKDIPPLGRHAISTYAARILCIESPWFGNKLLGYEFMPSIDKRDEGVVIEVSYDRDVWWLAIQTSAAVGAFSLAIFALGTAVAWRICRRLDETEHRHEVLAHDISLGYWQVESTGASASHPWGPDSIRISAVNPAYCQMVGLKSEQVIGRNPHDLITSISRGNLEEWLREVTERGTSRVTMYHKPAKGPVVHLSATGRMLPESVPGGGRIAILFDDMTEQERMAAALRASTSRYSGILGATMDAMMIVNATGSVAEFNAAAEKILGDTREDTLGQDFIGKFIARDKQDDALAAFRRALSASETAGGGERIETTAVRMEAHNTPREFPCELEMSRLQLENELLCVVHLRDITTRVAANSEIRRLNDEQERKVDERTAQLKAANVELEQEVEERRRATDALRRSEERLQFALESTEDALWDWDVTGGRFYFSARWFRMLGYEPGELPSRHDTWKTVCHPDDWGPMQRRIEDHFAQRTASFEFEHRLRTKAGNWRWILGRGRVMKRDPLGQPMRMVGTNLDVTLRRDAEQKVRDSERKYRILLGNINAGVALLDAEGNVREVNQIWLDRRGVSLDAALGNSLAATFATASPEATGTPPPAELLTAMLAKTRAEGEAMFPWSERGVPENKPDAPATTAAAPEILCEVHLSMVELDGQTLFHAVSYDITRRIRDAALIHENEVRFNVVGRHTGLLVYDYTVGVDAVAWSGAFAAVTGWSEVNFRNTSAERWLSLVHPADRAGFLKRRERSCRSGHPFIVLYRLQHRAGHYNLVEDHGIVMRSDGTGNARILGFIKPLPGMSTAGPSPDPLDAPPATEPPAPQSLKPHQPLT